jgi:hypothetical protein
MGCCTGQAQWCLIASFSLLISARVCAFPRLVKKTVRSGRKANELAKKNAGLAGFRGRALPAAGTAALLVAIGTAGCGVFQAPAAPAGLQKQILSGERVGAATRKQAARSTAGAAGRAALPSAQPVPGRDVTAIGDSVMSASAMSLAAALPGIYIDAKPDREMPAGLSIARQLARSGKLRPVLVMGLGTNYIVTTAQLQELLQIIGPHRKLVLINTYVPDGWSKQVNATDAAFIQQHPRVVLADWYDTIKNRLYLLWPDQVHPMMPGTVVYAHMVYDAVQATRDVTTPVGATEPAVDHNAGS